VSATPAWNWQLRRAFFGKGTAARLRPSPTSGDGRCIVSGFTQNCLLHVITRRTATTLPVGAADRHGHRQHGGGRDLPIHMDGRQDIAVGSAHRRQESAGRGPHLQRQRLPCLATFRLLHYFHLWNCAATPTAMATVSTRLTLHLLFNGDGYRRLRGRRLDLHVQRDSNRNSPPESSVNTVDDRGGSVAVSVRT